MAITLDGTSGITAPTYAGTVTAEYSVPVTAFKNRIINGAMNVWQRGTSSSTNGSYISDRFFMYATSSITGSRSTDVPSGFQYSLSLNGSAYPQIYQRIESNNCADLVGQTITISFWAKQTVGAGSNSIAYTLYSPTAVDNYTSVNTLGAGSWTGSSSWTYYTVSIANLPASAANGLQLLLYANVNGSSTILITGVQLEKGSTATSFDYRPYGTELQLCQRYYFLLASGTSQALGMASYQSTTYVEGTVQFPVQMRAVPTLECVSGTNYYGVYRANTWDDLNSFTAEYVSFLCAAINNVTEASGTVGQAGWLSTRNASSKIAFGAEL